MAIDPYIDERSDSQQHANITGAIASVAAIAAFVAARKKVALVRGVSQDIVRAGLSQDHRFADYLAEGTIRFIHKNAQPSIREATLHGIEQSGASIIDFMRDLTKPLPQGKEQWGIATRILSKQHGMPIEAFPSWENLHAREKSTLKQIFTGPNVASFKGNISLGINKQGLPRQVGRHGGILVGEKLYFLNSPAAAKKTGQFSSFALEGMEANIVKSWGASIERERRNIETIISPRNVKEYIKRAEISSASVLEVERRKFIKEEYLGRHFPGVGTTPGMTSEELKELADKEFNKIAEDTAIHYQKKPSLSEFYGEKVSEYNPEEKRKQLTFRRLLLENAVKTRDQIAESASKTKAANFRFNLFNLQKKFGVGEIYASTQGAPQHLEEFIRKGGEYGFRHPETGDFLPPAHRRYKRISSISASQWTDSQSPWYLGASEDKWKRWAVLLSQGTFHKVGEKAFGIGITNRASTFTDFVRDIVGSKPGSYSEMWIKGMAKTGRAIGIGFGAYYSYQAINYSARAVTGWGPTDVAAAAYVNARQFQQSVLGALHITDLARTAEKAFPGTINSPLSRFLRAAAPGLMAYAGGRKGGPKGFRNGLALGIATALVTWGDITQSPEELHDIYTGEKNIPIRKGRWWLLGATPFFGGKIQYWRPHWYPLMRSKYQYQGQLWDSGIEKLAQGSPFSPILAPVLTGQMWDPYYWERKHYHDRPYPISGELFEPTMPFAWIGNLTVGRLLKPPVLMHQSYLGSGQQTTAAMERGLPVGVGPYLGFKGIPNQQINNAANPFSTRYQVGLGAYSQIEQMGLLGFAINSIHGKLTGQQNFLQYQTVLQTPRRATGYERAYWDKEIGDPGAGLDEGITEYFRRFLPHRRRNVDEYNPIPNTMPDWMPGNDYFNNFKTGDPYIKVPMGEARLPGPGYESLHTLHSGIPGQYDAIDRFLVLSNVAPYSDEYKHYKTLALAQTRKDLTWGTKVRNAVKERNALNQEYEFLDMSTEGVPLFLKPVSSIYRHMLGAVTSFPSPLDMLPQKTALGIIPAHINKWLPYKTPEQAYKDYRLYGSDYAGWDDPAGNFVMPYMRRLRGLFDQDYVPKNVKRQREIQEYFDKLKYIKYANLAELARNQGNMQLASKLTSMTKHTMVGSGLHAGGAMTSMPKEEKGFYSAFSKEKGQHRQRVLNLVPEYMKNFYMTSWNDEDKHNGEDPQYDIDYQKSKDLTGYFKDHYLPGQNWVGWHPDVSLDQVKLRVVKNEAFDMHSVNLWESNERQLARQPFTPTVENIDARSHDMTMLQNSMVENLQQMGLRDNKVFISRTPSHEDSYRLRINMKRDNTDKNDKAMKRSLALT